MSIQKCFKKNGCSPIVQWRRYQEIISALYQIMKFCRDVFTLFQRRWQGNQEVILRKTTFGSHS
jgi:hypothetical protein